MAGLLQQVSTFADQQGLWRPGAAILVAVSGGPDSLCLMHLLSRLQHTQRLRVHVAHFDHGLRTDSADDADFVGTVAEHWGLPYVRGQADVRALAPTYGGIEAAARAARYGFLRDSALALGVDAVATGHHADDQAETVLMRLMRGSGPTGLGAMRPLLHYTQWQKIGTPGDTAIAPTGDGPALVRPLLRTEHAAILAYCQEYRLDPRHDSTNDSPDYLRNRVRGYIIPLLKTYNSHIVGALGRFAAISADEDALLRELLDHVWPELVIEGVGPICLDRQVYGRLHRALRRRALRRAGAELAPQVELSADHIDRMLRLAEKSRGQMQLPGSLSMRVTRELLILEQIEAR